MKCECFNLLSSVGSIVEERNKRLLEKVFMDSLEEFVTSDTLILLHKPRHADNPYLEVIECTPKNAFVTPKKHDLIFLQSKNGTGHIHMDALIKQCINTSKVVYSANKSMQRGIFPIVLNHEVTGVVDFYSTEITDNNKKMINGLLHIYSKFIEVLYDNEHDTLTGLLNRKTFDVRLNDFFPDQESDNSPILKEQTDHRQAQAEQEHWVGMVDIDHFKRINDNYGHIFGDEVLLLFAGIMKKAFRNTDLLFRFGGEEFVVFLLNISEEQAFTKFDQFRQDLSEFVFPQIDTLTVSIGMTKIDTHLHSTMLLEQADQALYFAKDNGRNQVCNYQTLVQDGLITTLKISNNIDLF